MPSDFLYLDTNFPRFSGNESLPDRVSSIQNYVFILVEQLRYSLANLDTGNWNQDALTKYGLSITEPISIKIGSMEDNLTQIKVDADGLAARIQNAEGDITDLAATAEGLAARIQSAEGNITQISATADGIQTQVSDLKGNVSALSQTAEGLATRVSNAEGSITTLSQTAEGLSTRVSNAEGSISTLSQTAEGLSASVTAIDGKYTNIKVDVDGLYITTGDLSSSVSDINNDVSGLRGSVAGLGGSIQSLANGTYRGTFISGKKLISPEIETNLLEITIPQLSTGSGITIQAPYDGEIRPMLSMTYGVDFGAPTIFLKSDIGAYMTLDCGLFQFGNETSVIFNNSVTFLGSVSGVTATFG